MSKIKILSLFFALTMLLCALVSCAEDPYYKFYRKLEPLTDEQIEECNSAYREDYFGPYDEYISSKSESMRDQAEKAVEQAKRNMQKAAADLDFLAAAKYRHDTYNFDKCLYVVAYQQN